MSGGVVVTAEEQGPGYTPTTEDVCGYYASGRFYRIDPEEAVAEFDRWLAAYIAAVRAEVEAERGPRLNAEGVLAALDSMLKPRAMRSGRPEAEVLRNRIKRLRDNVAGFVSASPAEAEAERDARDREIGRMIAARVRQNCTPPHAAYLAGGDSLIGAVADWIENPPAWVDAPWRPVAASPAVEGAEE